MSNQHLAQALRSAAPIARRVGQSLRQGAIAVALTAAAMMPAQAAPLKVLFLGYDYNVGSVKNDILGSDARFDFAASTGSDSCGAAAPSLATLQQYDSVLVWGNCGPGAGLGNVLADFADGGGRVVLGTFLGYFQSLGAFTGRINSTGYNPFIGGTTDAYRNVTLGTHDASSALFDGVGSIASSYYNGDWMGVDVGATLVAEWSNGRPFVGVNAAGNVLNVSLFPNVASFRHASGNYQQLFRNALAYEAAPAPASNAVPEPASAALVGLALLAMTGTRRLARRQSR